MHQDNEQKIRRPSHDGDQTFEPAPVDCDSDELGAMLARRNRKVLDMLEEYDRRRDRRQDQQW